MERQPYRNNYSWQKKFSSKLIIIGICVAAIVILLFLLLFSPSYSKMEKIYIGKVVQIEGTANDIGLVEDFKEGKFILIKSIKNPSKGPNYYQLGGNYSIKILASSNKEYESKNDEANKSIVNETEGKEIKKEQDGSGISYTDLQKEFQNFENVTTPPSPQIVSKGPIVNEPSKTPPMVKNEQVAPSLFDESNKKKQAALEDCETMIVSAAKKADQIDRQWEDYKAGCFNKSATGSSYGGGHSAGVISDKYGRQWFDVAMDMSISSTNYIDNSTLPECRILINNIARLFKEIRVTMNEVSDFARKSSVYPGQIRKLREKYRMGWLGWEY